MFIPALLARTGLPVDVVVRPGHPLRSIRGVSRKYVADDPLWAAEIEARLLTGDYTRFFNADEPGLKALYSRSWHPDAADFLPFAPGSPVAASVFGKKAFYDWCRAEDLPIPETHACGSLADARILQQSLPGSWFLKADVGFGGLTVMRNTGETHRDASDQENGVWLVQRDEGHDVGSGIFLADRGRLLAWIGVKSLHCLNNGYGPTVLGCGTNSTELGNLCARVASASGVTGLTGFDFVRTARQSLVLIDSHLGRKCPMQHFDRLYGVDFASALRAHLDNRGHEIPVPRDGPSFIKYPEVVQLAVQGGLGALLKKIEGPVKMPVFPSGDPLIGIRRGVHTMFSEIRVSLGRWRRKLFEPA